MDQANERSPGGSSAQWHPADRVLFSWLDDTCGDFEVRLAELRLREPDLAAAVQSRLGRLQRLGWPVGAPAERSGPTAGSVFGDFKVLRLLGTGGMGEVYLAEQPRLGRRVALKVVRSDRLLDPAYRSRFQREARAVADLRDPGICAVLDVGEVDGQPYLAMQYVEGETLAERLAAARVAGPHPSSGPTTLAAITGVLQLFEKLARSLHVAHLAGVVHRDLKPGNIMIDAQGTPVLLDFGLALVDDPTLEATLTKSGDVLGTPAYMPPEQVQPRGKAIDARADVYSLAATLFECLTHQRPFSGTTAAALYEVILRDPTPDPRRWNPHLPADVAAVLGKAMEKEPTRRYATAADFADDLGRLQRHEPVRARRIGTVGRLSRWSRRNPLAAGFLMVLALALTLVTFLLRQSIWEREQASLAREEANRRTDDLEEMLNKSMAEVDEHLVRLPGSLPVRRQIAQMGMALLTRLEAEPRPRLRSRALWVDYCSHLADVHGYPGWPNLGDPQKAVDLYRRALAPAEAMLAEATAAKEEDLAPMLRNLSITYEHLGMTLQAMDRQEEALAAFQASLQLVVRFVKVEPDAESRFMDLGNSHTTIARQLHILGRPEEAKASFAAGRAALTEGLTRDGRNRDLLAGMSFNAEANALLTKAEGDHVGASTLFGECLELRLRMLAADPTDWEANLGVVSARYNLSELALAREDFDAAVTALQPAVVLARKLWVADPGDAQAMEWTSRIVKVLANALSRTGKAEQAAELHRQVLAIVDGLAPATRTLEQRRLWTYHAELATAILSEQGKQAEALALDERVLAERRAFVQADDSAESRYELLIAFRNLRSDLVDQKRHDDMLQLDQERLAIAAESSAAHPQDARLHTQHLDALIDLGRTKVLAQDLEGARRAFLDALAKLDEIVAKGRSAKSVQERREAVRGELERLPGGK